jgi:hypothetical protein
MAKKSVDDVAVTLHLSRELVDVLGELAANGGMSVKNYIVFQLELHAEEETDGAITFEPDEEQLEVHRRFVEGQCSLEEFRAAVEASQPKLIKLPGYKSKFLAAWKASVIEHGEACEATDAGKSEEEIQRNAARKFLRHFGPRPEGG